MRNTIICLMFLFGCSLSISAQNKVFFIPEDESFCILLEEEIEINSGLDTSNFDEFYVFKKMLDGILDYFVIIQSKPKIVGVDILALTKSNFPNYKLSKNKPLINRKDYLVFDSPYKDFPDYTSKGIIVERSHDYFIFLFTYPKLKENFEDIFNKLLDSLIINDSYKKDLEKRE